MASEGVVSRPSGAPQSSPARRLFVPLLHRTSVVVDRSGTDALDVTMHRTGGGDRTLPDGSPDRP
eukprot:2310593-Prymnesium_polylepis.1